MSRLVTILPKHAELLKGSEGFSDGEAANRTHNMAVEVWK